jgi:LysR family transcriptional regulator, regulator of abg operon
VPVCETDSPVTSARIVAQGVGVSCTPDFTAKEAEQSGQVKRVRVCTPPPTAILGLVYRTTAQAHPRIQSLRDAIGKIRVK